MELAGLDNQKPNTYSMTFILSYYKNNLIWFENFILHGELKETMQARGTEWDSNCEPAKKIYWAHVRKTLSLEIEFLC